MRPNRPNCLALLALIAVLAPASFGVAATRFTEISWSASPLAIPTTPPVDPFLGTIRFEFDESLLTAGSGTVGSVATPLVPTFVDINFDSFTTANVGATLTFVSGNLRASVLGGTLNSIAVINAGTDDFVIDLPFFNPDSTPRTALRYTTSGTTNSWSAIPDLGGVDLRVQTRVSDS